MIKKTKSRDSKNASMLFGLIFIVGLYPEGEKCQN
jgi:hypothetical protein